MALGGRRVEERGGCQAAIGIWQLTVILRTLHGAGVHVLEVRDTAIPLVGGEAAPGEGAGSLQRVISKVVEVGEIPQQQGPVATGGGQGSPVRGERQRGNQIGLAG